MTSLLQIPTLADIEAAHDRIRDYIHKTPVYQSQLLNRDVGGELFFKCENLQQTGAFKFRGALNRMTILKE